MPKPSEKFKKPQCPQCGSMQVLTRKTDRLYWCRRCLHEWPVRATKAAGKCSA